VWTDWWVIPLGIAGGLVLIWAVLATVLWLTRPGDQDIKETMRLLPDVIRLIKRLAADPTTPRGARIRSTMRSAGAGALTKHWQGTPQGLAALDRLCRLNGK
jgi:hypothetical protein